MRRFYLIWLSAFVAITTAINAGDEWKLDKAHSSVAFEVEHLVMLDKVEKETEGEFTLGTTSGKFNDFEITFIQGHSDFTDSKVEALIRVNSIDTGNEYRDAHLKSESFFYVNKNPVILFRSDSFEKTGEKTYKLHGDLTMRGVTKPIEFAVQMSGEPVERSGNLYVSFTATGQVNRYDYGLQWNEVMETGGFRISNYVKFIIQGNFMKKK